jgi:hypothetical protein
MRKLRIKSQLYTSINPIGYAPSAAAYNPRAADFGSYMTVTYVPSFTMLSRDGKKSRSPVIKETRAIFFRNA